MFLQRAALRPVPSHAVIQERAIADLHEALDADDASLQEVLDEGYRDLDETQPTLATFLAEELTSRDEELAQSVGYFLVVAVYLAFRAAFEDSIAEIKEEDLRAAVEALELDENLRADNPNEVLDSDDVLAMGQPALLQFIQAHVREAAQQSGREAELEDLDHVYRAVLVEVIALTHAVQAPEGAPPGAGSTEVLA